MAPNSSGNASSERSNSWLARTSGVASPPSCHPFTRRAHARRSSRPSDSTIASVWTGWISRSTWRPEWPALRSGSRAARIRSPYTTSDSRRLPKMSRSSPSIRCTAGCMAFIVRWRRESMRLHELNVGCFGGGTGLPSLLGGLKNNPWLRVNAVVTMFDSGGSSGQLRDELGVLPPGDVLKCALALARNEGEARRVLLSRLPTLEHHARLAGHTGGNLLLSMMEQYSGDFLAAVDGLRGLLGCRGRVWPVSVQPASVCAEFGDGSQTRGEVEVDAGQKQGQQVRRLWLDPDAAIHPMVEAAIRNFDAVIIGPGSFFTSLMPPLLVRGVREALAGVPGPIILISNLLTEGLG